MKKKIKRKSKVLFELSEDNCKAGILVFKLDSREDMESFKNAQSADDMRWFIDDLWPSIFKWPITDSDMSKTQLKVYEDIWQKIEELKNNYDV